MEMRRYHCTSQRLAVSLGILERLDRPETLPNTHGGHMGYRSYFVRTSDGDRFVKSHNEDVFTDSDRANHSKQYLVKEKAVYDHLSEHAPGIIPRSITLISDHTLVMDAYKSIDEWQWRAPNESLHRYTDEIIAQLSFLQTIQPHIGTNDSIRPSYQTHISEGWQAIDDNAEDKIVDKIRAFQPRMSPYFRYASEYLIHEIAPLRDEFDTIEDPDEFYFAHHDLRQANVAWHAQHGTRIIDWSWAGPGRKNSDITTLLIDLNKSGHNVDEYMSYFNNEHAHTLIGFWLAHSLWPTRSNDNSVRLHQVASAVSAHDLLLKNRQR